MATIDLRKDIVEVRKSESEESDSRISGIKHFSVEVKEIAVGTCTDFNERVDSEIGRCVRIGDKVLIDEPLYVAPGQSPIHTEIEFVIEDILTNEVPDGIVFVGIGKTMVAMRVDEYSYNAEGRVVEYDGYND